MIDISALCSFPSGTEAEWKLLTTPLPVNNIFYATDINILKRGDGIHLWDDLPIFLDIATIESNSEYIDKLLTLNGTYKSTPLMTSEDGTQIIPAFGNTHIPTGFVTIWFSENLPSGFLELDGSWLSKTTYSKLYSILGDSYGSTDTQFRLPDTRGQFIRGWSHGTSTDPDKDLRTDRGDTTTGDHVGTIQACEIQSHNHNTLGDLKEYTVSNTTTLYDIRSSKWVGDFSVEPTGGSETRPKNINVMFCIKY
jgi:microcystin-dependent protein